jgi:hypothetical protein
LSFSSWVSKAKVSKGKVGAKMPPPKKIRDVKLNEFRVEDLPISCGVLIVAPPGSGKSILAENIVFYRKHLYPVGKVFIGTEDDYDKLKNIFHPLYVSYGWDEDQVGEFVKRQKQQALDYKDKNAFERRAVLWFDDLSDNLKIWENQYIISLIKLGQRHWSQMALWCTQAAKDFPPAFRTSVSYVALGRNIEVEERKKLFIAYGSICGSQKKFDDIMDQVATKYSFVIIKKRADTNVLEECVFWFSPKILPPWTFGCQEYRKWAEARYNPSYEETAF